MKWLYKILHIVPPEDRAGITLTNPYWEVEPIKIFTEFLSALPIIIPNGSILYLEGGYPDKKLKEFFNKTQIANPVKIAIGTIWPVSGIDYYHIPLTDENIKELLELSKNHAEPEIAVHLLVYKGNKILIDWYDVFDDPFYLSEDIIEDKLKEFCNKLCLKYRRFTKYNGTK
ncbi:MAG TPA: hypothetical protein DCX95_00410 [Elusimicrobia bacterium]|nr:hypothetical protein [Elusimicrobiota bacterium]